MRLSFGLLAIGLVLIGVLGCKKEVESPPSENVQHEPRWLRITYEGASIRLVRDSINITGWEPGEETVYFWDWEQGYPDVLIGYRYPWQGEDSIDYRYDEDGLLWVNGKMVAGSYSKLAVLDDSCLIKGLV